MRECSCKAHVGRNQVADVCSGEPRESLLAKEILVDCEVLVHNKSLIVGVVVCRIRVSVEEQLGKEWEVLRVPDVFVVDGHEQDNASDVPDETIRQGVQR